MRHLGALVVVLACALPGVASAQVPAGPLSARGAELVTNIAKHHDTAGARLLGKHFYITTERDLTIYDVSAPEAPREVGSLRFDADQLGQYYFTEEDPDTNGRILIRSESGTVDVYDVSDKSRPRFLASGGSRPQHTISCVLDCAWAYGSEGRIVDLRDPANPRDVGDWTDLAQVSTTHDVTEVAPGMVLTSSQPMLLLDARTNPANPTVVATIPQATFTHANLWPHAMTDDIVLVGGESMGPACASDAAATFRTYSAANWQATGTFAPLDAFRVNDGLVADGRFLTSSYCVHWFTPHPAYRNGGLVAISWYEHGTRFLRVGRDGSITEVGHFLPLGSTASAAYWITDEILYVTDYTRGLDVLRFTGGTPPAQP